jgi:hypothetical protein
MSAPDNTNSREVKELLQQLKELHAPDRCEGPGNFFWHGMQRFSNFGSSKRTDQQKITDYWNAKRESSSVEQKGELKKLASKSLQDFYFVCEEVDKDRIVTICKPNKEVWDILSPNAPAEVKAKKQVDIDKFIKESKAEQVQQMFDIMILQWEWRTRMLEAWGIH